MQIPHHARIAPVSILALVALLGTAISSRTGTANERPAAAVDLPRLNTKRVMPDDVGFAADPAGDGAERRFASRRRGGFGAGWAALGRGGELEEVEVEPVMEYVTTFDKKADADAMVNTIQSFGWYAEIKTLKIYTRRAIRR